MFTSWIVLREALISVVRLPISVVYSSFSTQRSPIFATLDKHSTLAIAP